MIVAKSKTSSPVRSAPNTTPSPGSTKGQLSSMSAQRGKRCRIIGLCREISEKICAARTLRTRIPVGGENAA